MLVYMLIWTLVYLMIGLMTARVAYGIERSRVIAQERACHSAKDPVEHFREHGQSGTAVLSLVYGLAWPLVVPAYGFYRCVALVVMARPPLSRYERRLRAQSLDARIRELEESLDMVPDDAVARQGSDG